MDFEIMDVSVSAYGDCKHCQETFEVSQTVKVKDRIDDNDIKILLHRIHKLDKDCSHDFCKNHDGLTDDDFECEYLANK